MYVIKRVNIKQIARFLGILSALFATVPAIFGIGLFIIASVFWGGGMGNFMPFLWFIIMPLIAFLFGFIYGLIFGYIYNILAEKGYGFEMDIEMLPEANK